MSTLLGQPMLQDLELAGLVPSTQEVYLRCVRKLTAHCFDSAGNGMTLNGVRHRICAILPSRLILLSVWQGGTDVEAANQTSETS